MPTPDGHDGQVDPTELYSRYIDLYIHLDQVLWHAIQFVSAVTAVGFGFLGGVIGGQAALTGLSHRQTIAIALLPVGVLILLGSFSLRRIREDTKRVVVHLRSMEGDGLFFAERSARLSAPAPRRAALRLSGPSRSATVWYARIFATAGTVLTGYAIVNLIPS